MRNPKFAENGKMHVEILAQYLYWGRMAMMGLEKLSEREAWRRIYLDTKA